MEQKVKGKPFKEGMVAIKGTVIDLVVAKGNGGEATQLPNLVGLTINEARKRLMNLTLSLHTECLNCEVKGEEEMAVITRQSPGGGESVSVAAGSTVTVWAEK